MTAPPASLALSLDNRIEALGAGADAVEDFLAAWAIDPGDRAQVLIILDEIGSNIINGAWPGGGDHRFSVELRIEPAGDEGVLGFVLVATDDGIPFDPTKMPPPDIELSLDEREPGGLGLFMVGEMSDSVQYTRVNGHNRLEVTKRLAREPAQPA